jgi:predicted AAA+ superfamily ATPase
MALLPRLYTAVLDSHLGQHRQMAFVSGPRQVGKTTICKELAATYLDWDNADDRKILIAGPQATADRMGLSKLVEKPPVVAMDEIHKYRRWKGFLKGFYDTYGERVRVIVTGSSRLDVYRRGGDSLMGRFFRFRMHPLSVAEILHVTPPGDDVIRAPEALAERQFEALWEHGGFPEPFVKRDPKFTRRWQQLRKEQLLRQDVRDLTAIQEISQLEILADILAGRSGSQIVYANLSQDAGVSIDTVRRWIEALAGLHYGFLVRPWFRNVSRALRKEPKWYLRDWSLVSDSGARAETFVACHLLKAVEGWTDLGLGLFELRYVRDKEKHEVDFVVIRDNRPWFIVEVKVSDTSITPALAYFQKALGAPHAFQAVMNLPYVPADCFGRRDPTVVPTRTLLAQFL